MMTPFSRASQLSMHSSDARREEEGRSTTKQSVTGDAREEQGGMAECTSHKPSRRLAFSRLSLTVQICVCLCVLVPVTGMSGAPGGAARPTPKLSVGC
eukprot:3430017-Rhodomonas_salina.1